MAATGLAACSDSGEVDNGTSGGDDEPQVDMGLSPADGNNEAAASTEIRWDYPDGEVTAVSLTTDSGDQIEGEFHSDGDSWVPAAPLNYETTFTATVTATNADGEEVQASSTFQTMASPGNRIPIQFYSPNNATVGQAAVVAFEFLEGYSVPEDVRRDLERRLQVVSNPAQEGSWHWINGTKLEYRPKEYWKPETTVSWRLGLGGFPFGDGNFGDVDVEGQFTTDSELRLMEADDSTKNLSVQRDGYSVKNMPISLGKDRIDGNDARSYSGNMVIMSREEESKFVSDLYDYETDVKWAMRLTWSGQYIHGAPWAAEEDALGNTNISHGCINLDDPEAEWLYDFVKWGDPVIVSGTDRALPQGDGITTWDLSWDEVLQGSYTADS